MSKITREYIEDHLAGTHTEESWARAITEMVLKAAITKLGSKLAEEITIDAQFHVRPVDYEAPGPSGAAVRYHCMQVCLVISPTGHEVCFHKSMLK